jgi:hypothetical protein
MTMRALISAALLVFATPAFAEQATVIFGSSTQAPVTITVNPATGLPVAAADLPKPIVASAQ